jgi:uncharacterized phage-associated protein
MEAMTTVFDVATTLIERSGGHPMSTVKLQKLCFFTFGWYAHLTGDSLFPETFYAMEKGPVVGELLSAHAEKHEVSADELSSQFGARDEEREPLSPYASAVLDGVLGYYGQFDQWQLVRMAHEEGVWQKAWDSRPEQSKRGVLTQQAIIAYFLGRTPRVDETLSLPPSAISFLTDDDVARIDSDSQQSRDFVSAIRGLREV